MPVLTSGNSDKGFIAQILSTHNIFTINEKLLLGQHVSVFQSG